MSMSRGLNAAVKRLEELGLVILKDSDGNYITRGKRNLKINGENIKPLLANAVSESDRVSTLNYVNVIEYIARDDKIVGAFAIGAREKVLYIIRAKAVICAAGGASGLYKPNRAGFSRHKMWYSPFNTGAGYAMGIRAGAEMTTLEMRFIALRCKDTIAPTGTIAQGVGAKQINALGETYEDKYGLSTSERLYGTVRENLSGRGPCYLNTVGITDERNDDLQRAYLNMAPSQTLKWIETGKPPKEAAVEIEGTEPYIVGGHTASGYWVDANRETTIKGLFAAGDAAGGCPQKYVSGAFAEAAIAARSALKYMDGALEDVDPAQTLKRLEDMLNDVADSGAAALTDALEEEMQSVMDEHAGGIGAGYAFSQRSLSVAGKRVADIELRALRLKAGDARDLTRVFELLDRLTLAKSVIAHLGARKESRWRCFCENTDYPYRDDKWLLFVNSKMESGRLKIIYRDIQGKETQV